MKGPTKADDWNPDRQRLRKVMNQKILAGIGNVYSDEILFQARIHPEKKTGSLDEKTLTKLFQAKWEVLNKDIESRADPKEFPKSFMIPRRHGDRKCPRCRNDLVSDKIAGSTTNYCPKCQKR